MPTNNPVPSYDPTDLLFNAQKLDEVVNSASSTYADRLGTPRRTLAGLEAEFPNARANAAAADASATAAAASATQAANEATSAATAVDLAFAEATAAQAARTGAESARDAALIQAGVYVDEPTGRAAVADGVAFKVQGSGDVAAYEYRRVNASSSTLISSYPSKAAIDNTVSALGMKANVVTGKNLFNPADPNVVVGSSINGATGAVATSPGFRTTGFISVTAGQSYAISHRRAYAWYDSGKVFISGSTTSDTVPFSVVAPAGAVYFRTAVYDVQLSAFQIEVGAVNTAYEAFKLSLDPAQAPQIQDNSVTAPKIANNAVTTEKIVAKAVTPEKASFFVQGKNLFDKSAITADKYVANTNGLLYDGTAYYTSDYIPVVAGSVYSVSGTGSGVRFTCYYDANKQFVAGGANTAITTFTPPAGAAFIRITIYKDMLNTFQVELGSASTAYEVFKLIVDPDRISVSGQSVPEIVVPPYVYGVQGRECNVYLDNLHVGNAAGWEHNVDASISGSQQQNERWTWTPSAAATSGSLNVSVHDKASGILLASKTMQQRAAASDAGNGLTKKVLVIGDSLINASVITQTLLDIATTDVMKITLLGTRAPVSPTNRHEGRGGWSFQTYATDYNAAPYGANPFWIGGAVNFPQYLIDNAIETPDWVPIHLGINDAFAYTSDAAVVAAAATAFGYADTLISSIKAAGAGVKVALMIPPPPSSDQDAFGSSYGTGQTRWRHKRNILIWARELIAKYAGKEDDRIYLVPSNTALDTVNGMKRAAAAPVNSRSSVTVSRQSDGVHPADSGYQQMGDALWAFLKYYA